MAPPDHQRSYERARQAGGIVTTKGDVTGKTRARSAEADISLLHWMMNWASTVRLPTGAFLLLRNPLRGIKRVSEKNKKQPVATWERYEATIAAIQKLRSESDSDEARIRWTRIEFALFLAERTGKRLGSIRQLRWENFAFERQIVYRRAEADKKGYKWEVPMPTDFFESVRQFRRELAAVDGFVFAAPNSCDGMIDRSRGLGKCIQRFGDGRRGLALVPAFPGTPFGAPATAGLPDTGGRSLFPDSRPP